MHADCMYYYSWVKTSMGQALADALNQKEPSLTTEESAQRVLKIVSSKYTASLKLLLISMLL